MTDIRYHPAFSLRAPGRSYVLKRFHPDRLTFRGYLMEARIWATSFGQPGATSKFIVIGRPRSGTTLLTRLLNQVPSVQCDPELLHYSVASPRHMINRLTAKASTQAYGVKWLSYQMTEVQRQRNIRDTLERMAQNGYRYIHLTRETFDHLRSLIEATHINRYSSLDGAAPRETTNITLDSAAFKDALHWSNTLLDFEHKLLEGLPVLSLTYEADLEDQSAHQGTIDRICSYLEVPTGPVSADVKREKLVKIENLDDLRNIS
ncbi:MAG: sulfotransferase [Pelagimonas sp.]|nr:sulfotransferase [Pelagimonas sp.]